MPDKVPLSEIINDQRPVERREVPKWREGPAPRRKDLRPALIIGAVVVYSVTFIFGATAVVIINVNQNDVARSCIDKGGQWEISPAGDRQCVRPEPTPTRGPLNIQPRPTPSAAS